MTNSKINMVSSSSCHEPGCRVCDCWSNTENMRSDLEGTLEQDFLFAEGRGVLKGIPLPEKRSPDAKVVSMTFAAMSALEELERCRFGVVVSSTKQLCKEIGKEDRESEMPMIENMLPDDLCWLCKLPAQHRKRLEELLKMAASETLSDESFALLSRSEKRLVAAITVFPKIRSLLQQLYDVFTVLQKNLYPVENDR